MCLHPIFLWTFMLLHLNCLFPIHRNKCLNHNYYLMQKSFFDRHVLPKVVKSFFTYFTASSFSSDWIFVTNLSCHLLSPSCLKNDAYQTSFIDIALNIFISSVFISSFSLAYIVGDVAVPLNNSSSIRIHKFSVVFTENLIFLGLGIDLFTLNTICCTQKSSYLTESIGLRLNASSNFFFNSISLLKVI